MSLVLMLGSVVQKIKQATKSGELKTLFADGHLIKDSDGIEFSVMVKRPNITQSRPFNLQQPQQQPQQQQQQPQSAPLFDPFMPPYSPDLHISEWTSKYYSCYALLLNKFNVMNNHVLIVTTHYESQFSPLTAQCIRVLHEVVCQMDGFGFYNAGVEAGPSQSHRHMQVVSRQDNHLPFFDIITDAAQNNPSHPFSLKQFRFKHSICHFSENEPSEAVLLTCYNKCLLHTNMPVLSIDNNNDNGGVETSKVSPHNLLMGRHWLMVVPRRVSDFMGIPGNGLNFIGSFFVNEKTFETLKNVGPMNVLIKMGITAETE